MELVRKPWGVLALGIALCGVAAAPASAQTLEAALVQAYLNNPSLNAQRAAVRATDENVSQALAGYRPRVSANVTGG
jgi:outer membrane protein